MENFTLMKNWTVILLVVLFMSCQQGKKQQDENSTVSTSELVKTTVLIGGMHCDMCVASVTKGVTELAGVDSVYVSLSDSNAVVLFDAEKTSVNDIEEAIIKRGYSIKSPM